MHLRFEDVVNINKFNPFLKNTFFCKQVGKTILSKQFLQRFFYIADVRMLYEMIYCCLTGTKTNSKLIGEKKIE